MAWQAPKTNWDGTAGVTSADLNRIEENTRVLSTQTNLYAAASRLTNNDYSLDFASPPTVALGFSCLVKFASSNTTLKQPVRVRINGTFYNVTLNYDSSNTSNAYGLPTVYLLTNLVYRLTYNGTAMILEDDINVLDPMVSRTITVGNTVANHFPTIQAAIDSCRKMMVGNVTINVTDKGSAYVENIKIEGFMTGVISVRCAQNVSIQGSVDIKNNQAVVSFSGDFHTTPVTLVSTTGNPASVSATNNRVVYVRNVRINGLGSGSHIYALQSQGNTAMTWEGCTVTNVATMYYLYGEYNVVIAEAYGGSGVNTAIRLYQGRALITGWWASATVRDITLAHIIQ